MLQQRPVSTERQAFEKFLAEVIALMQRKNIKPPTGFISYAWEVDAQANQLLQNQLIQLKNDFAQLGIKLFLDIHNMNGNMQECMKLIQEKDFIFLIGTTRFKERAAQNTNVAFEFELALKKTQEFPHALMPLLFQGDFNSAFPQEITSKNLIRDFREVNYYYRNFVGLSPLGLLPAMCPSLQDDVEYRKLVDNFLEWRFDIWREQNGHAVNEDLALYIPARGDFTPECRNPQPMEQHLHEFLHKNAAKVMLILGGSGSGKTMYGQYLAQQLLKTSSPKNGSNQETLSYTPIWISLPSLKNPKENAIKEGLQLLGVPDSHIDSFKQRPLLIILDAYDEVKGLGNLYESNHLEEWNAKVIVTCRSEFLTAKNYSLLFKPEQGGFLERYIAPFSASEISAYLQKYIDLHKPIWDLKKYEEEIDRLPALKQLIETPFLLHIVADVFPDIAKRYQEQDEQVTLTRRALYERFIDQWFERHIMRWMKQSKLSLLDEGLSLDEDDELSWNDERVKVLRDYAEGLAHKLYSHQLDAVSTKAPYPWIKEFFDVKPRAKLIRSACPLKKTGEDSYGFIHKSLLEYLVTPKMVQEIQLESTVPVQSNAASSSSTQPAISPMSIEHLNQQLLLPAMIQFLADAIIEKPELQKGLWAIIESSKQNDANTVAAANAITILSKARISFSGKDLSNIRVRGADLSAAVCDNTNFENADLSHINFTGAWLHGASFKQALMSGVELGEYPAILKENTFYSWINSCCYSPDGQYLAVSMEYELYVYDVKTLKMIKKMETHIDGTVIRCREVHFSPDGKLLASSGNEEVRLWSVESGKVYKTLKGHSDVVNSVHFSVDGKMLASCSAEKESTIKLWSVENGQLLKTLEGHTDCILCVRFSPNRKFVVSSSGNHYSKKDNTVRLWIVETGALYKTWDGNALGCNAFSLDSNLLAFHGADNKIKLWSIERDELYKTLEDGAACLNFSSDRKLLVSGYGTKVKVWSVETGQLLKTLEGHIREVSSVQFSSDMHRIVSCSPDSIVRFWSVSERVNLSKLLHEHNDSITSIRFGSDGKSISTSSNDQTVKLWSVDGGKLCKTMEGFTDGGRIFRSTLSPDGKFLALPSKTKEGFDALPSYMIKLWAVKQGLLHKGLENQCYDVRGLEFSPNGKILAATSLNKIFMWFTESGEIYRILENDHIIYDLQFSHDGKLLISASDDIKLWSVEDAKLLKTIQKNARLIQLSPNGKQIALCDSNGTEFYLWSLESEKLQKTLTFAKLSSWISCIQFSPDGNWLVSSSHNSTLKLWDVSNSAQDIPCYTTQLSSCATTAAFQQTEKGLFLATGHSDFSLRYWQLVNIADKPYLQLLWSTRQNALLSEGANLHGVRELSSDNTELLKQRGAIEDPLMTWTSPKLFSDGAKNAAGLGSNSNNNAQNDALITEKISTLSLSKSK